MSVLIICLVFIFLNGNCYVNNINFTGAIDFKGNLLPFNGILMYDSLDENMTLRIEGTMYGGNQIIDSEDIDVDCFIDSFEPSLEIAQGHVTKLYIASKETPFDKGSFMIQKTPDFLTIVGDVVVNGFDFAFMSPAPSSQMIERMYYSSNPSQDSLQNSQVKHQN